MPPPRAESTRRAARRRKEKPVPPVATSNPLESSLIRARRLEECGHTQEAISVFEKIVAARPFDAELYAELGTLYMQSGLAEDAEKCLRESIKLQPNAGFEKFACLAQILGPTEEALSFARRGVELITMEISSLNDCADVDRKKELREYEASAQCAVAEIALTIIEDSNDPTIATKMDSQVEHAVMAALAASDAGSISEIEATLALANMRLSQGRQSEACTAMTRVFNQMSGPLSVLDSDVKEDALANAVEDLPPLELRIAIGKQLIETELYEAAARVLSSTLWECDFNVEVWYMLAISSWKQGELGEARNALETTRKVLHNPEGYDGTLDERLIDTLLEKLTSTTENACEDSMQD